MRAFLKKQSKGLKAVLSHRWTLHARLDTLVVRYCIEGRVAEPSSIVWCVATTSYARKCGKADPREKDW